MDSNSLSKNKRFLGTWGGKRYDGPPSRVFGGHGRVARPGSTSDYCGHVYSLAKIHLVFSKPFTNLIRHVLAFCSFYYTTSFIGHQLHLSAYRWLLGISLGYLTDPAFYLIPMSIVHIPSLQSRRHLKVRFVGTLVEFITALQHG